MWVARIKLDGSRAILGSRCKKFGISVSGYPVSTYNNSKELSVYCICFMFGESDKIDNFVKDLSRDKKILHAEHQNNFLLFNVVEPKRHESAYRQSIIHLEPLRIEEDGMEFWTIGSWEKKDLIKFLDTIEKSHRGKLLSVKKENVKDFSFLSMNPQLTDNQRKALEFATSKGYYSYPRKIDIKELAKMSNLSYTTFHEHLRKAEQKMMPFATSKTKNTF